jgi:hypothetical protein
MQAIIARRRAGMAVLLGCLILAACAAPKPLTQPSWPAPSDPMTLAAQAGLVPTEKEHLITHTHAHLDVIVDGQAVEVPSGIGIDIESPGGIRTEPTDDETGTQYFVTLCPEPCLSPLHTHDPTGILHTESKDPDQQPYTLGQFFTEWGLRLDDTCVGEFCRSDTSIAIYLNGAKYKGNPADIKLESHLEIAVVIGKPPPSSLIPDSWNFFDLP